jgi:hypothetical protein
VQFLLSVAVCCVSMVFVVNGVVVLVFCWFVGYFAVLLGVAICNLQLLWCCYFVMFCSALAYRKSKTKLVLACRNDHTTMTAPLPVCSAKLSIVGPG